jgi:hypothetical protein
MIKDVWKKIYFGLEIYTFQRKVKREVKDGDKKWKVNYHTISPRTPHGFKTLNQHVYTT